MENVFFLRTPDDAVSLREKVDSGEIKRAVIVGGGFIGLEAAENLAAQGVKVSVIDFAPHVLSELLDPECCAYVEAKMAGAGVMPFTGVALEGITGNGKVEKVLTSRRPMKADAVLLAMATAPTPSFWRTPAWRCLRAPCWWTEICAPTTRTSTPWATAPW